MKAADSRGMMDISPRRTFLRRGSAAITAFSLALLDAHRLRAQTRDGTAPRSAGYGPLQRVADQRGAYILALPRDFQYVTFCRTGEALPDGTRCPRNPDGMGAFAGPDDTVRLIRNHEVRNRAGDLHLAVDGPAHTRYDALAGGGTLTIDFDPERRRVVRAFTSLNGTLANCAGGHAWRDAGWISCEESVAGPREGFTRAHGYAFLVPASAANASAIAPLKWMGRFVHEAAVADALGVMYETEDAGDVSGFYRATPDHPRRPHAGGRLQMLALRDHPHARPGRYGASDRPFAVRWVDIGMPDPDLEGGAASCFAQGFAKGGASFHRLEGIHLSPDRRSVYFVSTGGGSAGRGQLWRYTPAGVNGARTDELTLAFESPDGSVLDSPDNLSITPRGGILFQEDDATRFDRDTHALAPGVANINRLVGLDSDGATFVFALNMRGADEFAGACWSADGRMLFVNLYGDAMPGSGMTCAIWGPWARGPL